ncbi:hypothetical protein SAMN02910358_02207 [Lachnospiraceae bacterium XBB1006]|nr:hypothetical protein SAMN02910358_02207 [Lachnospiraceae bacterium XBB1006]
MIQGIGVTNNKKYNQTVEKPTNGKAAVVKKAGQAGDSIKTAEADLSDKAKAYLEKLKKSYGDYNFIVADSDEEMQGQLKQSDREFSVIFSSEELEKMAADESYAKEKTQGMEKAVELSKAIAERLGINRALGQELKGGATLEHVAISFKEDQTLSIFAQLEQLSEQKDKIMARRTSLNASGVQDLFEKIDRIEWDKLPLEEIQTGDKIDYSV